MLKAARIYNLWVLKDQQLFKKVAKRVNEQQEEYDSAMKANAFEIWYNVMLIIRKKKAEDEQRERFIDILRNSTRGHRSTMEKEEIRRFIVNHMSCIPKSITFSEMDTLCNELDWIPYIGRSILFLQGDFGNCYYMIASGRVGLYLEPSKDREMVIAREFGNQRLQPFQGTDEDLQRMGQNIVNLQQGSGFGEFAILATSNKIRSCAAVALDPDSMLLVMHADTYNAVLRQHHYRQKQLSSATALLQELPLFQHQNYSKLASIAYTMRSQTYSNQALIVGYGDTITKIMLVSTGQVKVYAAPNPEEAGSNGKLLQKRIPKLAIALLGRGQIIGELEVQKGLSTFQMTYESGAAGTEVLEMPLAVFKESISTGGLTQSMMYKNVEELNNAKEQKRVGRLTRAYDAMKIMMAGESSALQSKEQLVKALPVLVEPPVVSPGKGPVVHMSGPMRMGVGTYYGDERPAVVRRQSFAVATTAEGEMDSPRKEGATRPVGPTNPFGGGGSLKFVSPSRKGSLAVDSPRRTEGSVTPARAQSVVMNKSPFSSALAGKGNAPTAGAPTSPHMPKPSTALSPVPRVTIVK